MGSPKPYELLNLPELVIVGAVDDSRRPQTLAVNSPDGSINLGSQKLHSAVQRLPQVRRTRYLSAQQAGGHEAMAVMLAVRLDKESTQLSELVSAIRKILTGKDK